MKILKSVGAFALFTYALIYTYTLFANSLGIGKNYPLLKIPLAALAMAVFLVASAVAETNERVRRNVQMVGRYALRFGLIGWALGTFGGFFIGLVLGSNLGPLLGMMWTGPAGVICGALWGGFVAHRQTPRPEDRGRDLVPQDRAPSNEPATVEAWVGRAKSGELPAAVLKDLRQALDRGEVTSEQFEEIRKQLLLL